MKIAFLCQPGDEIATATQRGASVALGVYEIARRVARSHPVLVIATRGPGQPERERDAAGVEIRRLPVRSKKLHRALDVAAGSLSPPRPFFASPFYYTAYFVRAALIARRERADLVHFPTYSQAAPLLKRLVPRARLVLHMHGEALSQLDRSRVLRHLRAVDLVLGCSDDVRDKIRARFPELAAPCRTLHNGVDLERFGADAASPAPADDPRRRVLFVGRVSPEKGVHVLLEAAREFLARYPHAQLDVVGSTGVLPYSLHVAWSRDPRVAELRRFYGRGFASRAREQLLGAGRSYVDEALRRLPAALAARVRLHGAVGHASLPALYRDADVFVYPSVWPEPFGMPTVEAMACGLPVVATAGGGIPEIVVDGETGILVKRGDADALAAAVGRLLDDRALAAEMGAAGRQRAATRFSWDRVSGDLLDAYAQVLPG